MADAKSYTLISADTHAGADLRDYKAYLERRWHDEFDAWAREFSDPWGDIDKDNPDWKVGVASFLSPVNWDSDKRLEDLEQEGVAAEVIFPNTVPPFYPSGAISAPAPRTQQEYDRRWAGVRAHNRWLVDFCNAVPGRRAGIAQVFLNDIDAAIKEIRWAKEAGLKGILLPGDHLLNLVNLYYPRLDPVWAVCAELDIPVHRHGIAVAEPESPETGIGAPAVAEYEAFFFMQRPLDQMIFAGVFDRFPDLKFVFTETTASWVPQALAALDAYCHRAGQKGSMSNLFGARPCAALSKKPSSYFCSNFYIGSFFTDFDVANRHELGMDRLMWGADYPHHEGTSPYTSVALRRNFSALPEDEVRQLTSINAAKLYGFDLDFLQTIANRIGPSVEEISQPVTPDELPEFSMCPTFADYFGSLQPDEVDRTAAEAHLAADGGSGR